MDHLRNLYQELNNQFWSGRLPKYRVKRANLPGNLHGFCVAERRVILVRYGIEGEELRRLMLHEMCHIGCPYHGAKFQSRLLRLAGMGEEWAVKEAESCRNGQTWNETMAALKHSLYDIANSTDKPIALRNVVAWLAHDLGRSSKELLRVAPWVRATWRNAQLDAAKGRGD